MTDRSKTPRSDRHRPAPPNALLGEDSCRLLLESAQHGVWALDRDGIVVYANPRLCAMAGRDHQDLTGRRLAELIPPEDRALAEQQLIERLEGIPTQVTVRLRRPDGSTIWTLVSSTPMIDGDGRVTGSMGVALDVTVEHSGDVARAAQAERLELLVEIRDALSSAGPDTEALIDVIASRAAETFEATVVVSVTTADGRLATESLFGPDTEHAALIGEIMAAQPQPSPGSGLARALATGDSWILNHASENQLLQQTDEVRSIPSGLFPFHVMWIPLRFGDELHGLLSVVRSRRHFSPDDLVIAKEVAQCTAVALNQAKLFSEMERRSVEAEGVSAELREMVSKLADALAERQALAARLVVAQEEERRRIAGEIHDDSIQALAALGLRLSLLRRHLTQPDDIRMLDGVDDTLVEATSRLRNLLFDLRPPTDDGDLAAALGTLGDQLLDADEIDWRVEVDDTLEIPGRLTPVLYRIAREALINLARHAHASEAVITVANRDGGVEMTVSDDGIGFDPSSATRPGHLGIAGVHDQAELIGGTLVLDTSPGAGTRMTVWLPTGPTGSSGGPGPEPHDDVED